MSPTYKGNHLFLKTRFTIILLFLAFLITHEAMFLACAQEPKPVNYSSKCTVTNPVKHLLCLGISDPMNLLTVSIETIKNNIRC
jgi:hypothetical protein